MNPRVIERTAGVYNGAATDPRLHPSLLGVLQRRRAAADAPVCSGVRDCVGGDGQGHGSGQLSAVSVVRIFYREGGKSAKKKLRKQKLLCHFKAAA